MKRRITINSGILESKIERIVKNEISRMLREDEAPANPKSKAFIMADMLNAMRNSKWTKDIASLEGEVEAIGKYDYYIEYEVTERPGLICTQREVHYPVDYACPAEYELVGNFDFEIKSICVYDSEGEDDYVYKDMVPYMTKDEIDSVKDMMEFDMNVIAYDEDTWYDNDDD